MKIPIVDAQEFHTLLKALIGELTRAQDHFRLLQDLIAAQEEFAREFNQSQAFWSLTMGALQDATLQRLCKAYDPHKGLTQPEKPPRYDRGEPALF